MTRRVIRASEVGAYLYCQRAWWYQSSGLESSNQAEMNAGTELHHRHGQAVVRAGCLRALALALLLAFVALAAAGLASWLFR